MRRQLGSQPCLPRARGGAAIMAMIFLVAAVIFVLAQTRKISATTGTDNLQQLTSTAALFLAESGAEHAQGLLRAAALAGSITNASCTGLTALAPVSLGTGTAQGTFRYSAAVSTPALCGGANPACTSCAVTIRGDVGSASRSVVVLMSAARSDGVEGYGHQFTLDLETTINNTFAFTHLAYNPQTNWGGDAVAGYCVNNGPGSLTTCTESWKVAGTYYNNSASQGVFATAASAGIYTITEELKTFAIPPAYTDRNYVQTGVTFRPTLSAATVTHVGSYTSSPNNICVPPTTPRMQPVTYYVGEGTNTYCPTWEYQHAYLPSSWTCNPNSGTSTDWSNAANADTLILGFGGKPYYGGSGPRRTSQLSGLSLNGQPIRRQLTMTGTQGDNMYSQVWYAYNPAYYSSTANATNLASVATFSATMGATFSGHTTTGANRLVLDSSIGGDQVLSVGDLVTDASGSTSYGTLGTLRSGTAGQSGAVYNLSGGSTISPDGTALKSYSTVMRLASAPSSGAMALNDSITDASGASTYGVLGALLGGTLNAAGSTYQLTGGTPRQISAATDNMRAFRASTTITLSGATSEPLVGTALAVVAGTGQFLPDSVTGSISGTTLTVSASSGSNLSAGDALFGAGILANTRITARASGTGGNGTYAITPSQSVASGTIIARAAVVAVTSANSFSVSRLPNSRLVAARLCGGLCPFLLGDGVHAVGQVDLTGILDYDDWSGGFACLRGVDPASIETLGTILSKRSGWSEVVQ